MADKERLSMSDYLDNILSVAERFHVFPVDPDDHAPALTGWQKWATQNADTIRDYWTKNPDDKVGILTGFKSGVFVVDLDRKKGKDGVKYVKALQ